MFEFLHTYHPQSILFQIGPFAVHWYGLLIAIGIGIAWLIVSSLAKKITQHSILLSAGLPHIERIALYGIIFGLIGARMYHVFSELPYYIQHPIKILYIWQGGLGIFGALIGALIVLTLYCRKHKLSFLLLTDIFAPGIILAQAIGRWGNYFNNEVFGLPVRQAGLPTGLSWGIPIPFSYRPIAFASYEYFHPTFLYESLWNILVFVILFLLFKKIYKSQTFIPGRVFALYLILYSFGRFFIEFIRIDYQPELLGLRLAQIVAIGAFSIGFVLLVVRLKRKPG